ncbi:MAG TPA: hypothetical protein DCS05_02410 [Nitrospiraceae bacterium]|nr:hypothetical protein [Nitrospiraceae bacterium]
MNMEVGLVVRKVQFVWFRLNPHQHHHMLQMLELYMLHLRGFYISTQMDLRRGERWGRNRLIARP